MNIYTTLNYITDKQNRLYFMEDAGATIGKFVSDKKLTGQDSKKKTYAKNAKIKAAKNGFAYFTDGTSALIDRGIFYKDLFEDEPEKDNNNYIEAFDKLVFNTEKIKSDIMPLDALAIAKINGYTGTLKDEHPYFLEVCGNVYDMRKFEKFYYMLATKKELYNSGLDIRLDTTHKKGSQALILSSNYGTGIILPVFFGPEGVAPDMGENFYCCNASKFYKLYSQIEKESFGTYEPEQVEKTA